MARYPVGDRGRACNRESAQIARSRAISARHRAVLITVGFRHDDDLRARWPELLNHRFYDEVSRVLIPGAAWGRNLDAFNDVPYGGFGTPEDGFVVVWKNHDLSREALGEQFDTLVEILSDHQAENRLWFVLA